MKALYVVLIVIDVILLAVLIRSHTQAKTPEEKEKANKFAYITLVIALSASILAGGAKLLTGDKY